MATPVPVEVTGISPGALLDALNRAESLAYVAVFGVVLIGCVLIVLHLVSLAGALRR